MQIKFTYTNYTFYFNCIKRDTSRFSPQPDLKAWDNPRKKTKMQTKFRKGLIIT